MKYLSNIGISVGRTLGLLILLSTQAMATTRKCENLVREIKSMKMAQHQLLESRSATTELFSNALNQHADNFEQILADSQRIKKSHVQNLRVSAKAFQKHENQESQLIQRFEKASDQLLDQVQACIEQ